MERERREREKDLLSEDTEERSHMQARKTALTKNQISALLDLRLSWSPQL